MYLMLGIGTQIIATITLFGGLTERVPEHVAGEKCHSDPADALAKHGRHSILHHRCRAE